MGDGMTLEKLQVVIEGHIAPYKKAMEEVKQKTDSVDNHVQKKTTSIANAFKKVARVVGAVISVTAIVAFSKSCIELGSNLSEVQNVVDVTFGSMNQNVNQLAKNAITQFGLSELAAKKYMGTYGAMAKSFGFDTSSVYNMSAAITGLTGDVASFYNLSTDEAYTKLKSIFTGETESLKELGVVMTQTALDQYALNNGFGKTTSEMTEQEKVMLRYQFVMSQLSDATGDFARTSNSWANQTKVLSLRFEQLKATIGQGLINALTPALRVINTLMAKLQTLAEYFKALTVVLFGDAGGGTSSVATEISAITESTNAATEAAKAYKKQIMGFDQINILSDDSSSTDSTAAGFNWKSMDYGAVSTDHLVDTKGIEKVAEIIRDIAEYVPVIVATLGALKLGSFITDLVTANTEAKTLKETISLLGKKAGLTIGITLSITGIALETKGIVSAIQEGLNGINFAEILGGGGVLVTGGAMIGKFFGSALLGGAIAGIVAGIPAFIAGIYDAVVGGLDWLNAALISISATAAGAGIGAIIGMLGGPIGAGIGALIGFAIGLITDLVVLIVQKWDEIVVWCSDACAAIGQFFYDLWQDIVDIWNVCAEWFDTNVIQPVIGFFVGLWEGISTAASDCWTAIARFFTPAFKWFSELFGSIWQTISDIFYNIGVVASGCWEIIKAVWVIVSTWFDTKIIQPVTGFFAALWSNISNWAIGAWENIKAVFSTIGNWINANIIQPVSYFFSGLWNGFLEKAHAAWEGVKAVFSKAATFFSDTFKKAWEGIVKVFSIAGNIFNDIKDGILTAFKLVVNGIIKGLNSVIAVPFNGINTALQNIKKISILGMKPFSGLKTISVPQIPYLEKGGIVSQATLAMIGENGREAVMPLERNTGWINQLADQIAVRNGNTSLSKQDIMDVMIYVFQRFMQIDFYIGDEKLAKHVRAGELKLDRRLNPT